MGDKHKTEVANFDEIIESSPDSPPLDLLAEQQTTRVIYVCNICLRQYTLVEDLRGHMIEYHNFKPITPAPTVRSTVPNVGCTTTAIPAMTTPAQPCEEPANEEALEKSVGKIELRPMPFKDFRIVLRAALIMRCTVTNGCPYKFENALKLDLHVKCHVSAAAPKDFKCTHCGLTLTNWRRCSAHIWKAHEVDVDLLHCPHCTYKAHASVLIWRHMRVHKKWRPRVLRSLRAVQRQRQRQEASQMPSKVMPKPPPVNKNKYYAEKTCEICNRKFVNGKTLSKHVKAVHNKIKPFICNVCGKKTARKASLIIHMRQHTGEKPLQCKICKFSTRDPSVLHKHQLRHGKMGKFKCDLCDYSCVQTNAYKRHMRLNHPEEFKKISCDLCNYVTISAERLQTHKNDHRNGLIVNQEDSMDATRMNDSKNPRKLHDKNSEISADCFLPLESIDSLPHEPAVDTGGVTIPAPSEDTQFPTYLNN